MSSRVHIKQRNFVFYSIQHHLLLKVNLMCAILERQMTEIVRNLEQNVEIILLTEVLNENLSK